MSEPEKPKEKTAEEQEKQLGCEGLTKRNPAEELERIAMSEDYR